MPGAPYLAPTPKSPKHFERGAEVNCDSNIVRSAQPTGVSAQRWRLIMPGPESGTASIPQLFSANGPVIDSPADLTAIGLTLRAACGRPARLTSLVEHCSVGAADRSQRAALATHHAGCAKPLTFSQPRCFNCPTSRNSSNHEGFGVDEVWFSCALLCTDERAPSADWN